MSSWAFVLGDSVLGDSVLGAFVWIPCPLGPSGWIRGGRNGEGESKQLGREREGRRRKGRRNLGGMEFRGVLPHWQILRHK